METGNTENKEKKEERTYRCNDCGNIIYKHEVFCSKCGKTLDRYDFEDWPSYFITCQNDAENANLTDY